MVAGARPGGWRRSVGGKRTGGEGGEGNIMPDAEIMSPGHLAESHRAVSNYISSFQVSKNACARTSPG